MNSPVIRLLCSITCVLSLSTFCCGMNNTTALLRLQDHIVSKQNLHIRDSASSISLFFNIAIDFVPVAIVGLDEETQVFSFSAILIAGWVDPAVAWDPADFNNIHSVTIEAALLWSPKLTAINSVDQISRTLKEDAFIFSSGRILTFYADPYKTSCQIDTDFFPFDEQTCEVLLFPSGMYQFHTPRTQIDLPEFFFRSNEWHVLSITIHNRSYIQPVFGIGMSIKTVAFQFKLKRYSAFYVMSILAPIGILSFMNACVFILPVESGEKMSYLVSILVSYAMFLNFVYGAMPRSDSISRLTIYLLLVISQSCMSIVTTICLLNVYHGSQLPGTDCAPPGFWKRRSTLKIKPDCKMEDSFVKENTPKSKVSTQRTERFMFVLFKILALLSLLVFVDF